MSTSKSPTVQHVGSHILGVIGPQVTGYLGSRIHSIGSLGIDIGYQNTDSPDPLSCGSDPFGSGSPVARS